MFNMGNYNFEEFKKSSKKQQIEEITELYFDYGKDFDKEVLEVAKELKKILLEQLEENNN